MDAAAGGVMLTVCLGIGGAIIRASLRSDAAARRRHPYRYQPPTQPFPRDPRARTLAEQRALLAEPGPRTPPPEPEDAVPPRPEPKPHRPGMRSPEELRALFSREPQRPDTEHL